jgi:bacteriorhodopsin
MGKFGWSAIVVLLAALAADQYFDYGYYTDGALAMLRQISHSFTQ